MRLLAIMLLVATMAGCLADEGPQPLATDADGPEPQEDREAELEEFLEDHPTFCNDESDCDYWDDMYHQYVVYDLDTVEFDVLVLPPAGASTPDNIAASRQAVQAWSDGIMELGQPWLTENFSMDVQAVGVDVPSPDVVQDPEIVVASASAAFLFGIGLEPKQITCMILGEEMVHDYGGHYHDGNWVGAADCTGTGFTCFALNAGSTEPGYLYDLIAHEVGHCLGAGHVGDALDFRARYAPVEDIMSYQNDPQQVHCVSSMNVRNLEGVYAHLLDRPEEEHLPRGSFLDFHPLDYEQVECANPPGR